MTKEEAIKHLEDMKKGLFLWDMTELIDLCISALSENKGDLISRQAVNGYIDYILSHGMGKKKSFDFIKKFVANLSSATPQQNKGEWIEVVTGRFPNGEKRTWHYECSACSTGEPPCPINKEHWDFCPNCGADMRGEI